MLQEQPALPALLREPQALLQGQLQAQPVQQERKRELLACHKQPESA